MPARLPHRPHPTHKPPLRRRHRHGALVRLLPAPSSIRHFHTTRATAIADHYTTLGLSPSAPSSEVKKQFYKLSKAHHPDRNPDDPVGASKKFVAISEAYAIVGDPAKRETYDRDLERANGRPAAAGRAGPHHGGGGGGGSYAGGRQASGLSKRRAPFRGPPPSFYRSGGWGDAAEKREANMGRDARDWTRHQQQQRQRPGAAAAAGGGGGGDGAWPFATDPNDVAHFDRAGHFRTQSTVEDQLRKGRRKRRGVIEQTMMDEESMGGDSVGMFFRICGMLAVGLALPLVIYTNKGL